MERVRVVLEPAVESCISRERRLRQEGPGAGGGSADFPKGGKPRPIPISDFDFDSGGALGPDGDRLLYVAKDRSIRIVPFSGGEARKVPGAPLDRADSPVQWDADGRTLYVWRRGEVPAVVDRMDLTTGTRQPWKKLMPEDPAGVVAIDAVVVSRDGLSYAYSCTRVTASDLYVVDGLYK
jgi:hypothetical protein